MTASALSGEQLTDLDGTLVKLRTDGQITLAEILTRAMAGERLDGGDATRLHVYADYCDRSGFRHRCAAIKALLLE